ncbi:MAG TPA: tetratricopeptide repeat protein [Candidatus Limnocylindria bacterium]|jgi:tetratricopeptide (TPR) repeat protein|nr:tetratricopeptide repeat protein [Candidatus Limnocylindria bacterium]
MIEDDARALNLAGAAAFARRDWSEAERLFTAALQLVPRSAEAAVNLARVYEVLGLLDDAADLYERVGRDRPDNAAVLVRLGIVRYGQSRLEDALEAFEAALRVDPRHLTAAVNGGLVASAVGRHDDAVRLLRGAVGAHPGDVAAWTGLADALRSSGAFDDAEAAARSACEVASDDAQAWLVRGQVAYDRGAFAQAEEAFRRAAQLAPERHEPPMNLGGLYHGLGRVDDALVHLTHAVVSAPQEPRAHVNLGMSLLLAGDSAAGFAELEWRLREPAMRGHYQRLDALPRWNGESLDGGRVLIALEQGIGDFLFLSRFVPLLRARGVTTALEIPPALAEMYHHAPGIDEVLIGRAGPERLASFAAHLPLCSLPYVLGAQAAPDPHAVPYLRADPKRIASFRARFAALGKRMTVGIVWAGDPAHALDRFRSCALAEFGALAGVEDVAWVSLQKGAREADVLTPPPGFEPFALGPELADYADTAAAIMALDLVIAVDTSVAHLAGALGAPIWTLHGFGKYWLWGVEGARTPWYPTMRLFRQTEPNRWADVFADVRAALGDALTRF